VNRPRDSEHAGKQLNSKHIENTAHHQAAARRLIGSRWSDAVPDTTMSAAFLAALRRKAVVR
jgi:hypothetical protein